MEKKHHILVIDDDKFILSLLVSVLGKAGYRVSKAADGETGLQMIAKDVPDLVVTDYKMPGISGFEVLNKLTRLRPGLPVIILTGHGDVGLTIKAIQAGAYDFIEKPIKKWELLESIRNGIHASVQSQSLSSVIAPHARKAIEDNLPAGKTPAMRQIFKNIGRISLNNINVMITGEAGTGKKQIARLIHYSGINRNHPFVIVNCHSADEKLLEQELFGYPEHASGRISDEKRGKFSLAGNGTLFFDEITQLSQHMQHKLLRVLQNNEFENSGQTGPAPLNARIIAASCENMEELVQKGDFLPELFFRIENFRIHIPPLHKRKEDIPELISILVQKLNKQLNRRVLKIEKGVEEALINYHWPGNIRELENVLAQALILTHGDVLELKNISVSTRQPSPLTGKNAPGLLPLSHIEKEHILQVLNAVGWNKLEASRILQITRPTLNSKIKKYELASHRTEV